MPGAPLRAPAQPIAAMPRAESNGFASRAPRFPGPDRSNAGSRVEWETVAPAPLTITANDANKVYGSTNLAFTTSYTGFVLQEFP